jgi:hypothetical protein
MKQPKGLWMLLTLALTASLALASPSLAQGRGGGGPGQAGQGGDRTWQRGGPGAQNCPNYPGYQNSPRVGDQSQAPQGRGRGRGMGQGGGRRMQQANPPAVNPPANQ